MPLDALCFYVVFLPLISQQDMYANETRVSASFVSLGVCPLWCMYFWLSWWRFSYIAFISSLIISMVLKKRHSSLWGSRDAFLVCQGMPYVIINSVMRCIVPHRVHGAIGIVYKYHFYWRSFACFVPSISAIFDTISTHKLSHKRASLWQQDVYFIIIHSCRIFIEGWFKKEKRWVSFCAKCMFNDVVFFSSAMNRYKRKAGVKRQEIAWDTLHQRNNYTVYKLKVNVSFI